MHGNLAISLWQNNFHDKRSERTNNPKRLYCDQLSRAGAQNRLIERNQEFASHVKLCDSNDQDDVPVGRLSHPNDKTENAHLD